MERRRTTPGRDPVRRRVIPCQSVAGPGIVRTEQRAQKAGIIVFGRGLWHTGQRDPGCCLKRTGKPAVIWQDQWCDQPYRPAYPAHTCEDRCEKDRGRDINYTCERVGWKGIYAGGGPVFSSKAGSETFFRLRTAGYRDDLGKRSMGRELGPWRLVWSMTGLVCKAASIKGTKIISCFTISLINNH